MKDAHAHPWKVEEVRAPFVPMLLNFTGQVGQPDLLMHQDATSHPAYCCTFKCTQSITALRHHSFHLRAGPLVAAAASG